MCQVIGIAVSHYLRVLVYCLVNDVMVMYVMLTYLKKMA